MPTEARVTARRTVIVCAAERSLRSRIAATLAAGGHECTAQIESSRLSDAELLSEVECLVLVTARSSGRTLKVVERLREQSSDLAVILACERASGVEVRRTVTSGTAGVVLLSQIEEVLPAAVSAVCAGHVCVPANRRDAVGDSVLTTREKQILGLVVMGMTNAAIARKLYLAESTVKSHLSSAFAKLGVSSRNEAATVILDPQSGAGLGILTIPNG